MATLLNTPFIPGNFIYLADRILNYTMLMINGRIHRICEIEFYLNSSEHMDPYVHCDDDQTKTGTWYFHRHKNGTYKNGTYKGMDIVLGSPPRKIIYNNDIKEQSTIFGAILIRSIIDVERRKLIEGPCRTVNHILELTGYDEVKTFTQYESLNFLDNERGLILVEGNPERLEPLLYGSRIGLSDKYPLYRNLGYRFVIGPVKKERDLLYPLPKEYILPPK